VQIDAEHRACRQRVNTGIALVAGTRQDVTTADKHELPLRVHGKVNRQRFVNREMLLDRATTAIDLTQIQGVAAQAIV
jgi:hypothetical protein